MASPQYFSVSMSATTRPVRIVGPLDWFIAIALIAGGVSALPVLRASQSPVVTVYRDSVPVARYPIDTETAFSVEGALGPVQIAISEGTVRIVTSTCPRQVCVAAGAIRLPGSQIVCAPNHLLVQLSAHSEGVPDAVAE